MVQKTPCAAVSTAVVLDDYDKLVEYGKRENAKTASLATWVPHPHAPPPAVVPSKFIWENGEAGEEGDNGDGDDKEGDERGKDGEKAQSTKGGGETREG